MANNLNRYVYIGLTKQDIKHREFYYSITNKSDRPLAEDINSLRRIIKERNLSEIKYYTTIPYSGLLNYSLEAYNYITLDKTIMGKISATRVYSLDKLFHGSPIGTLTSLIPQKSELVKGFPIVFAGERWVAVSNSQRWSDNDFTQGTKNHIPYLTEKYAGAFNKVYGKGGYVYSLSSKNFKQHNAIAGYEYYSKNIERVLDTVYIADPIRELLRMGVQLNFYNEKSIFLEPINVPTMLHLSRDPNLNIMEPRIPTYLHRENIKEAGLEDHLLSRISFAPTINGCLLGIQINEKEFSNSSNITLYVYKAEYVAQKNILPNDYLVENELIYDAHITGESWVTSPVKVSRIGAINVYPYDNNPQKISFTPLRLSLIDKHYLEKNNKITVYLPKWEYIN